MILKIAGNVAMGDESSAMNGRHFANYDTERHLYLKDMMYVVKLKDIVISRKNVEGVPEKITQSVSKKHNIWNISEGVSAGDIITKNRTIIIPILLMPLGVIWKENIAGIKNLKVTMFITKKQIVDDADIESSPGQTSNSNTPSGTLSITTYYTGIIQDNSKLFEDKIKRVLGKSNMVIFTRAVSIRRDDLIADSLRKLRAIFFHKVTICSSDPVFFAYFFDETHYFGLPKNFGPAVVGLCFFDMPLLSSKQGTEPKLPITTHLLSFFSKKQRLHFFCKVSVSVFLKKLQQKILKDQESFNIHPLIRGKLLGNFFTRTNWHGGKRAC